MPIEGFTVTDDEGQAVASVEATPEALHLELASDDHPDARYRFEWDRLTAERVARAILAELAATRRR